MKLNALFRINRRQLGIICLCIIAVILFSGLWPHTLDLRNQAALLPDGKGLLLSGRGILYSPPLLLNGETAAEPGALSIEISLQPDREWRRSLPVILALDDGMQCARMTVGQWQSSLIIRSRRGTSCQYDRSREIGVRDVLLPGTSRFISISSGHDGTAVYADGQLKAWIKHISLLGTDEPLAGRLVLGNSAKGKHAWTGTISALSLYNRSLSPEESLHHYEAWRDFGNASSDNASLPIASYLFNEQAGQIVKDHSEQGNDLLIPERFAPLRRYLLTPPWIDFQPESKYFRDIAINVAGFIPFGFFVSWYFSAVGAKPKTILFAVIVLGAGTSLFIEIVQSYLPARTSQLSDLIANTSGTAVGLFLWSNVIRPLTPSEDKG